MTSQLKTLARVAGAVLLTSGLPERGNARATDYSGRDIDGIEHVVEAVENGTEAWREEADRRIEQHRKADVTIRVLDASGNVVPSARVGIQLRKHAFRFGGAISSRQFLGEDPTITSDRYKEVLLAFFNAAGFNNALKYKLRKGFQHRAPPVMAWLKSNNIPVRGHTLIWPGWKHMDKEALRLKENPDRLRAFCKQQIIEYAQKWDVVEWDVINEPRGNHDIQDLLGKEVMVDWFKIARAHTYNRNALLYLNDFQVISAVPGRERHLDSYYDTVRYLLDHGAPLSALGFQSRFKADIPAEEIYRRLQRFEDFHLPMSATEFEIKSMPGKFEPSEEKRAEVTERVMTVYFSHPSVNQIVAWTIFAHGDKAGSHLVNPDGTPTAQGKVWLYLTKQRWTTREAVRADQEGTARFRGFLGEYKARAKSNGRVARATFRLSKDGVTLKMVLKDEEAQK